MNHSRRRLLTAAGWLAVALCATITAAPAFAAWHGGGRGGHGGGYGFRGYGGGYGFRGYGGGYPGYRFYPGYGFRGGYGYYPWYGVRLYPPVVVGPPVVYYARPPVIVAPY